jgi:hypothetical protein
LDSFLLEADSMAEKDRSKIDTDERYAALYHVVYAREGFEEAAQHLFKMVQRAQELQPDRKRVLFLDIEGHRNSKGGFDSDMLELQKDFLIGFLGRFLSEIRCPLAHLRNPGEQDNEIPGTLIVQGQSDQDA